MSITATTIQYASIAAAMQAAAAPAAGRRARARSADNPEMPETL